MLVADTNVLIGLLLPTPDSEVVLACRDADDDWRLPGLWVLELRHVLLTFLRAGLLDRPTALTHLSVAEPAQHTAFAVLEFGASYGSGGIGALVQPLIGERVFGTLKPNRLRAAARSAPADRGGHGGSAAAG